MINILVYFAICFRQTQWIHSKSQVIYNLTFSSRCREYREQLKKKGTTQESELEDLKVENFRLKQKEEHMRATLEKVKKVYLDLIVSGRVTFVQ